MEKNIFLSKRFDHKTTLKWTYLKNYYWLGIKTPMVWSIKSWKTFYYKFSLNKKYWGKIKISKSNKITINKITHLLILNYIKIKNLIMYYFIKFYKIIIMHLKVSFTIISIWIFEKYNNNKDFYYLFYLLIITWIY